MLDGTLDTIWIIQTLQCGLATRASLAKIKWIIYIPLSLKSASLHRPYHKTASCRAFAACRGVRSAQAVVGIFGHLHIRLAFNVARRRPTPSEDCASRRAHTGQF